ncbi:ribonuclease HI family protein [Candidatus Gottesmanbacteria bacterium]|nr:ribonuclease HI family protein [Candidatus Gottesmanbacteria bacterium]
MTTLKVYTDGGSRGNPGQAGIGVVIYKKDETSKLFEKVYAFGKKIGISTNNVAEYTAIIEAWRWIILNRNKFPQDIIINFYLDSFLAVNQLNGRYKLKSVNLTELLFSVKELQQKVDAKNISYNYVIRVENMEADFWVNKALDSQTDFVE